MNCQAARYWIMTARGDDAPPAVRRHLSECRACRVRVRRLLQMEDQLKRVPAPPCDAGLQTFLRQIPNLPARPAPSWRGLHIAASILFLAGISGAFLYFSSGPATIDPGQVQPRAMRADDQLVRRFVERDLVLADTTAPAKQWQVFIDMADDLRSEAIRLADEKAPDDVPMVVSLYERVLQRGVLGRASSLPAKDRQELQRALADRLRTHESDLQRRLQQTPPDWLTLLQPIQNATRQTADTLAAENAAVPGLPHQPEALPRGSDYRRLLLSALVMNGLRLAEESDPLKRADCCSDLADHLLKAIVTASVKGDQHNVSALGLHLGEFVERGVSANLARVPSNDPRVAELKEVMQRTNQILIALDTTLDQAAMKGQSEKLDPAALERIKDLERMLKDVEKSLKKVHRAFKDGEKGKEKEKEHRDKGREREDDEDRKGKGKGKSWSMLVPAPTRIESIEALAVREWTGSRPRYAILMEPTDPS
jgi:hypothetical protein